MRIAMIGLMMLMAADVTTVPATPATAVDFTWLFIKMLLLLAVVCLIAILFLKFGAPRLPILRRISSQGFAQVLARQAIDQRKVLHLVKIGKRYLVIGTADHAISPIAELTEEDARGLDIKGAGEGR